MDPSQIADHARLVHLLDRQDILDCLTRFCRGMDRFDRALFLSAFHADAVISAGPFVGGPEKLYDWASDMHAKAQSATLHSLMNHTCDVSGDVAHAETYYLFLARNRDDTNWAAAGRYIDRLERRGADWRIAVRCNAIEWSGAVPALPIPFADVPNVHLNGRPARDSSDISYRRPLANTRAICEPSPGG